MMDKLEEFFKMHLVCQSMYIGGLLILENVFVMNVMGVHPHEIFVSVGLTRANFSFTVFVFRRLKVAHSTRSARLQQSEHLISVNVLEFQREK